MTGVFILLGISSAALTFVCGVIVGLQAAAKENERLKGANK